MTATACPFGCARNCGECAIHDECAAAGPVDGVRILKIEDERAREAVEQFVAAEYAVQGLQYYEHREPVMIAAFDGDRPVGVLCARPYQNTLSPAFAKYAPALDCPFICELGKVVTAQDVRTSGVIRDLWKAMHLWGTNAGYAAFYFECHPELARKYVRILGFAQIGANEWNDKVMAQSALMFSSANNPRLVRWLFGTESPDDRRKVRTL